LSDITNLVGQVAAHRVDRVGQIFPGSGDAGHQRLTAELAFGADFASDARHFGRKRAQLIDHRVDGLLELQDFAAHVDGDFLGQIAIRNCDRHVGYVTDLCRQVARHRVDALGQILPNAGDFTNLRLPTQLAVSADLARDAGHLGGKDVELFDHPVDDRGRTQKFTLQRPTVDLQLYRLQQVAPRHRRDRMSHRRGGPQQIVDQRIDRALHFAPGAVRQGKFYPTAGLSLASDDLAHLLELVGHALVGADDLVERIGDFSRQTGMIIRQPN
jgi:hypothetical protein